MDDTAVLKSEPKTSRFDIPIANDILMSFARANQEILRAGSVIMAKHREPAPVAAPIATAIAIGDGPDAEYQKLADRLGVKSAVLLESKLEAILAEEMIAVYEYAKVEAYLNNLVERRNYEQRNAARSIVFGSSFSTWSWCSLRKGERKGVLHYRTSQTVYQQAIPMPVLLTVDKIQSQLPEARFFISQIEEVADPFLAVTVPGSSKLYVIERWDEPGFRS